MVRHESHQDPGKAEGPVTGVDEGPASYGEPHEQLRPENLPGAQGGSRYRLVCVDLAVCERNSSHTLAALVQGYTEYQGV